MAEQPGNEVQTLKMNDDLPTQIGVVRKYDDHDRRRSSTLRIEAPSSADARKVTSFVRARNSGVNRLLRSDTGSATSSASYHSATGNGHSNYQSFDAPTSVVVGDNRHHEEPVDGQRASLVNGNGEDCPTPKSHSNSVCSSFEEELNGEELDFPAYLTQKWTHVVLKMTSFSDEDLITSFRFGKEGGGIGRDDSNVASIPADKLLAHKDHARILYSHGRFYIVSNPQAEPTISNVSNSNINSNTSSSSGSINNGTFIRLSPSAISGDDDGEDRMQWPLELNAQFRVGKSDFIVTNFHEATQTLEITALSGKLAGTSFMIGPEGAGIGRSAENKIHAGDGELSRKHAAIWFDNLTNMFYLVDLNSTNGTFMQLVGPYHEPYRLEIGDDILIAQTCLTVNRFDFGAHANMGARKHMEDAHTIIQDLHIESLSRLGLHPQSYFAVYDGHGGMEASSFLGDVLHHNIIDEFPYKPKVVENLRQQPQEEINAMISQRLIAAFEKTDEEFLQESERPQAGSTATTVFIAGKHMFVANVGDSRTVLSRKNVAVPLSKDHKPSRPDEAQRIRDTGGFVIHGRIMGELAVSRAFGDSPFKTFELPEPPKPDSSSKPHSDYDSQELPVNPNEILKGPLVIPTPEITITELSDDDEFILLASDGLFDVLKDQEAVDFVRQKIIELGDVQRAVEATVEHAIFQQRSMDNVTAVVVMFKDPKDLRMV